MKESTLMFSIKKIGITLITLFILAACADPVKLKSGAEAVKVTYIENASSCVTHGSVHVSVMNKIGPFNRSELSVEDELANLARNSALESGGDTVVPIGPVVDGARDFNVYVCRK
jgi:hypothetical protein